MSAPLSPAQYRAATLAGSVGERVRVEIGGGIEAPALLRDYDAATNMAIVEIVAGVAAGREYEIDAGAIEVL
jgi:small nuclear ribonucleoprotein (snRNP)-like protein